MTFQQNIGRRTFGIVVLLSNNCPQVREKVTAIQSAMEGIQPGELREMPIPWTKTNTSPKNHRGRYLKEIQPLTNHMVAGKIVARNTTTIFRRNEHGH